VAVTATPITSCIVDSANDVRIGGPDAPTGCSNVVVLAPLASNPAALDEIGIGSGGTLSVVGQAGMLAAHTDLTHRLIQTLGSCNADGSGDPSCPDFMHGETYYACPKDGCPVYTIEVTDPAYSPGPSTCTPYPTYAQSAPPNQNELVPARTTTPILLNPTSVDKQGTPYNTASNGPSCPATTQ
jgi:hypothetical protein